MIEKVEILNYRSCIDTKIDLQANLSVLIGPNGSGTTNILNAILLLNKLTDFRERRFLERTESTSECQLRISFRYNHKKAILTAKANLLTDENNADEIYGSKQSWYAKEFTNSAKRINAPLGLSRETLHSRRILVSEGEYYFARDLPVARGGYQYRRAVPEPFIPAFSSIAGFLRNMRYYSASQFTNPSLCPVSFEVEQDGELLRGLRLKGHSRFLYDLYSARETRSYDQFYNVIGPDGIGLVDKIEFSELRTSSIDYRVRSGGRVVQRNREKMLVVPQFVIGRNKLSPSQLSEGTFKTITLLFYLMTEQSSALLIEEPEVCVHHGLLSSIVELIISYSKSRFRKSCGSGQSADEEHDGGGVEEGAGRGDGGLEVLCQSPVAVDPGEEALHDPAARLDGEADLIGAFAHDLDGDHGGRGDLLAGVAAVGKDLLDERKRAA